MQDCTLNLIFTLITGKTDITEITDLDVWECKPAVTLLTDIFVKNIPKTPTKETE